MNRSGEATSPDDGPDFSLVLGGPLYQRWRRTRISDDTLHLRHRRVIVLALLAWGPLLLLSIVEGHAWGGRAKLTFFRDIEIHARLLLALGLASQCSLGHRIPPVDRYFGKP